MQRLSDLTPETMDADQRRVHDRIAAGPRAGVRGPLRAWLLSPEFADRAQHLGEFLRYGTSLTPKLSELAILTTARHWTSDYEWFAHAAIAARQGVPEAIIEAIRTSGTPNFEQAEDSAIYRFVTDLLSTGGVADDTFAQAADLFGRRGVMELVGIVGYYSLGAMTLSVFGIQPPEPQFG